MRYLCFNGQDHTTFRYGKTYSTRRNKKTGFLCYLPLKKTYGHLRAWNILMQLFNTLLLTILQMLIYGGCITVHGLRAEQKRTVLFTYFHLVIMALQKY